MRDEFFIEMGFLRRGEVFPKFLYSLVSSPMRFNFGEVPLAEDWKSEVEEVTCSKNLKKWRELVGAHREDLSINAEYEVESFEEQPFVGNGDNKILRRNMNFLLVLLVYFQRFVYSLESEDFLAVHSCSMKVVHVIACLFREMVTLYRNNSRILPDEHQPDVVDSSIETLALDLISATAKSRQNLLYSKVLRLTTEDYNRMNLNKMSDEDK